MDDVSWNIRDLQFRVPWKHFLEINPSIFSSFPFLLFYSVRQDSTSELRIIPLHLRASRFSVFLQSGIETMGAF